MALKQTHPVCAWVEVGRDLLVLAQDQSGVQNGTVSLNAVEWLDCTGLSTFARLGGRDFRRDSFRL